MFQAETTVQGYRLLACSCEDSAPVDGVALAAALKAPHPLTIHRHLCRSQLEVYKSALGESAPLVVACAQEAPLFGELAAAAGAPSPIFVDIRDRAGWSAEAALATPKMAALIADALVPLAPTAAMTLNSAGRILVLGEDQTALSVAARLGDERAAVCLLTVVADDMTPPFSRSFAVLRGRLSRVSGRLGGFEVAAAEVAGLAASARADMRFDPPEPARTFDADVILDLRRGAAPLWPARDGYLRCDPHNPLAVEKALAEALSLAGAFEKPRFVRLQPDICAHARRKQVACARCIDVCPTGAVASDGDSVRVDAGVCAGCGACAAACPTGALRYDVPAGDGLYRRLRTLLGVYAAAGGKNPTLLAYEQGAGDEVLSALARYGDGLPADALPFAVNAVAGLGLDFLLTAYAYGAARVAALASPSRAAELGPLREAAATADTVLAALGWGARTGIVVCADPDQLAAALACSSGRAAAPAAADYLALGDKRATLALAAAHLRRVAPAPADEISLPAGAPFGNVVVDADKCTLCQSCIAVCPTGALSAAPDRPSLGFTESACVQCGLCRVACPEKAVSLAPRLNFAASARERVVKKEEEPHQCPCCGRLFGTKSSIAMLIGKLADHPMFADGKRLELIKMCDDCRAAAQSESGLGPPRRSGGGPAGSRAEGGGV